MASIVCPHCNTENRAIAKFCIECIRTLPLQSVERAFAPTARAALTALGRVTEAPGAAIAAMPGRTKGQRVGLAALVVAVCLGAAGWWVAVAGGRQVDAAGKAQVPPPVTVTVTVAPVPVVVQAATAAPKVEAPSPLPADPVAAAPASASRNSPVSAPFAPSASFARSVEQRPTLLHATVELRHANVPAVVDLGCDALNFFSAARCRVAQCLKPEFSRSASCDAVRREQVIEEQARNPRAP